MKESELALYLQYIDSPFTLSEIVFDNDKVVIRKYVAPKMRFSATTWTTGVMIVARLKKVDKVAFEYIAVYSNVFWNTMDKFDDMHLRTLLIDGLWENWRLNVKK